MDLEDSNSSRKRSNLTLGESKSSLGDSTLSSGAPNAASRRSKPTLHGSSMGRLARAVQAACGFSQSMVGWRCAASQSFAV